jgi:hypothetical protein
LEIREEPIVVFVARIGSPQQKSLRRVDVVAGREHEPDVVRIDRALERLRHFELTALGRGRLPDAGAEIADDSKRKRLNERSLRVGQRPEFIAIHPVSLHQALKRGIPIPSHAAAPQLMFHRDRVGVARVGLESGHRAVVAGIGQRVGDDRSSLVADFDAGRPVCRRPAPDRFAARRVHPL